MLNMRQTHLKLAKRIVIITVLIILVSVLLIQYQRLNNINTKFDISPQDAYYGEYMQELNIAYHIYKPKQVKLYSNEYQQEIYRYSIPFDIENISKNEPFSVTEFISEIFIFSGGIKWQGTISEKNHNVKWVLDGKEKTEGTLIIDVIPNVTQESSLYKSYELYYVSIQNNVGFKYQFFDSKQEQI